MSWTIKGNGTGEDLLYSQAGTPSLDLRFAATKSLNDYVSGNNLITFTRASSGTFVDSAGVIQTAATDVPRFDHDPLTGESLGLLIEEERTNLLLNSGTLSTQSVTVTAVAHTLSFTGTGTITLTGTSTAGPLVGTGTGESNRVSLTFTPTAGSLTLTVSGTITHAQLEIGAFRTSYIATTGAAATRSADVASITGSAFSGWYRQDEGTVFADAKNYPHPVTGEALLPLAFSDNTYNNRITLAGSTGNNQFNFDVVSAGSFQRTILGNFVSSGLKASGGYKSTGSAGSLDGAATVTSNTPNIPSVIGQLDIGQAHDGNNVLNGCISRLTYWPVRLSNEVLQRITQP
jgi:hypothetical protein